jgi:hypothetical protein
MSSFSLTNCFHLISQLRATARHGGADPESVFATWQDGSTDDSLVRDVDRLLRIVAVGLGILVSFGMLVAYHTLFS